MEKRFLRNVKVVVPGQIKSENSSLPVAVRVSKTRVLKLPSINIWNVLWLSSSPVPKLSFHLSPYRG